MSRVGRVSRVCRSRIGQRVRGLIVRCGFLPVLRHLFTTVHQERVEEEFHHARNLSGALAHSTRTHPSLDPRRGVKSLLPLPPTL